MKNRLHPIATITTTSGFQGDVRLRPLSRYFDEYIEEKRLMLGYSPDHSEDVSLELISGMGKKRRFKFHGVDSVNEAEVNEEPVDDAEEEEIPTDESSEKGEESPAEEPEKEESIEENIESSAAIEDSDDTPADEEDASEEE